MSPWLTLLYQALATPYGILVAHESPESARTLFYQARAAHRDPALNEVRIAILADDPFHLYLFHEAAPCPKSLPPASTSGSTQKTLNGFVVSIPTTSE